MARKLTFEDLVASGVDEKTAHGIIKLQNQPRPKTVAWTFKATQKQAEAVARAFPDMAFSKRHKPREPKK